MPTITVLLGEMPQTLRAILEHALGGQRDMHVVHEPVASPAAACPAEPDVVIVGGAHADDNAAMPSLLRRWPRARLLMVTESGRRSVLYELRPHPTEMGQLSPEELVAAVRAAAMRPAFVVPS